MRKDWTFEELPLQKKLGQLFMIGFFGEELPSEVEAFIKEFNIGFVDLFARNVGSLEQVRELVAKIHGLSSIPPMVFTDQEGGVVCQFGELAPTFTSAMGLAATTDPETARRVSKEIASFLKQLGIDGIIAPVLDVNYEENNPIIGVRSFSDEPETVVKFGSSFIKGLKDAGLAAVGKHFPGHGGTQQDSHLTLPQVSVSPEYFRAVDLRPFAELLGELDFLMSAHVLFPLVDPSGLPATFSPFLTWRVLRDELEFKGVLITDCLEMEAIKGRYGPDEIARLFLRSGADVLLISHSLTLQKAVLEALLKILKQEPEWRERVEESLQRVLAVKKKYMATGERVLSQQLPRRPWNYEVEVCRRATVLLRDRKGKIPLDPSRQLLIVEWDKAPSTIQISKAKHKSYLEEVAREFFKEVEVIVLPLADEGVAEAAELVRSTEQVVLAPYSRTPEAERIQGKAIAHLLSIRKDAVVVAIGNPYDIKHFPQADTYVVTFGFRKAQITALFEILTGKGEAEGRLPVEIKRLFPRWHRWKR